MDLRLQQLQSLKVDLVTSLAFENKTVKRF
jgi:hypothetical protein